MQRISEKADFARKLPDDKAIEAQSLCKFYTLYRNQKEKIADALGLGLLAFGAEPPPRFCALDSLSFKIGRGEKVGLIGRNGAGKSTLLKLISGLLRPSSGHLTVNGSVQLLMYVGLGFHPEFTGRQNISASLLYNGLAPETRKQAEADIIEFAELHDFLDQPLRTYSLGMRSRLQFACATALNPDILIIDEVLAVGDAYFVAKCIERIKSLTGDGCTLLLASHSMSQIADFCDRVIWLEQGKITSDGVADTVVDAYQSFIEDYGA